MRVPLRVVVPGVLLGGVLALGGIALAPARSDDGVAATTTAAESHPAVSPWYQEHETVLGSSVIVLDGLTLDNAEAVLHYRVLTIAPEPAGIVVLDEDGNGPGAGVAPETWELETAEATYPGTSANTNVDEARFPVDDRFALDDVVALRITRFRMRVPYSYDLALKTEVGVSVALDADYYLTLDALVAQTTSVIVHLGATHPSDLFASQDAYPLHITGTGPEWLTATPRQFGGTQLIRQGPEVPDPLPLRVTSVYWVPFDRTVELDIGGLGLD